MLSRCYRLHAPHTAQRGGGAYNCVPLQTPLNIHSDPEAKLRQHWLEHGKFIIIGCYKYFNSTIMQHLAPHVQLYKAARLCHPQRMAELRFTVADVRALLESAELLEFAPFLSSFSVDSLVTELPAYRAAVEELKTCYPQDIMPFWGRRSKTLPQWYALACAFATIAPSSAAAERVFSILNRSFGDQQQRALEDYVAGSCMLQYNDRLE